MRNKDNREHSGAYQLNHMNVSRLIREHALSARDEFKGEFNAGGTADDEKRYPSRNTDVFRDVFL